MSAGVISQPEKFFPRYAGGTMHRVPQVRVRLWTLTWVNLRSILARCFANDHSENRSHPFGFQVCASKPRKTGAPP